jgi:Flp pilus assembly protein TadD
VLAKDNAKALTEVRAARARFADDPELAAVEANVLRTRGDVEAAVAAIEKLRAEVAGQRRRAPGRRRLLPEGQEFTDAERTLRHAREVEPKNLRTLFQLGAVLERLKKSDARRRCSARRWASSPTPPPSSTTSAT